VAAASSHEADSVASMTVASSVVIVLCDRMGVKAFYCPG
jgi:hypothetical protein